jgi:hypothetical protein
MISPPVRHEDPPVVAPDEPSRSVKVPVLHLKNKGPFNPVRNFTIDGAEKIAPVSIRSKAKARKPTFEIAALVYTHRSHARIGGIEIGNNLLGFGLDTERHKRLALEGEVRAVVKLQRIISTRDHLGNFAPFLIENEHALEAQPLIALAIGSLSN